MFHFAEKEWINQCYKIAKGFKHQVIKVLQLQIRIKAKIHPKLCSGGL